MPSQSFREGLLSASILLSLLPNLSLAWLEGSCTPTFGSQDVLRIELNPNSFASNTSLSSQRGAYVWVGNQNWRMDANSQPSSYPINAILSTAHNGTFISTSSNGAQDQPCPSSWTYNSNTNTSSLDQPFSEDCCTFNASYTCHGFYDLSTSTPIFFESAQNFTGSPEDVSTTTALEDADAQYGITAMDMILPENYRSISDSNNIATSIGHYGLGNQVFGFVDTHEEQVLGLGLNSTWLNTLYANKVIASRSLGLYFGVPASAGAALERNGSMVMGGYSPTHIQGNLSEQTYPIGAWKLPRLCPWEIDIQSLTVGSETSSTPFTACIDPSSPSVILPQEIYFRLFPSSTSSPSNLTISLSNFLTATIPSTLLPNDAVSPTTESNPSPILGYPFLSQFYIYADYQARTLAVGLANHSLTVGQDQLTCVEHGTEVGDLGWAVVSANATATQTEAPGATRTGGSRRVERGTGWSLLVFGVAFWMGL